MIKAKLQDEGIGRYTLLPCTTKRRVTTNLEKQLELPGNLTVGKSYNQGVKEEIFIQMGRGGDW